MGTIKQGILGGFSGKVGTVVGSSWKGISYMRGQAQSVKNPRTAKQVAQRDKFSLSLSFIRPIQSFIQIGFKTYEHKQSAFNAAMSYTMKNVIKGTYQSFSIDYTKAMSQEARSHCRWKCRSKASAGRSQSHGLTTAEQQTPSTLTSQCSWHTTPKSRKQFTTCTPPVVATKE